MSSKSRNVLALLGSAVVAVLWPVALEYWPPGTERNCLVEDCSLHRWLFLVPYVILPLGAGLALAESPRPRLTRLLGGLCSAGLASASGVVLGLIEFAPSDPDRTVLLGSFILIFGVLGTGVAYVLVGIGASISQAQRRRGHGT